MHNCAPTFRKYHIWASFRRILAKSLSATPQVFSAKAAHTQLPLPADNTCYSFGSWHQIITAFIAVVACVCLFRTGGSLSRTTFVVAACEVIEEVIASGLRRHRFRCGHAAVCKMLSGQKFKGSPWYGRKEDGVQKADCRQGFVFQGLVFVRSIVFGLYSHWYPPWSCRLPAASVASRQHLIEPCRAD
jgi:hypothetical protein